MFCLINSTKALFLFLRTDGSKVDAASVMTLGTSVSEMSDSQLDAIDSVSIAISYVNNVGTHTHEALIKIKMRAVSNLNEHVFKRHMCCY